jgi:hypothetical protein
LGPSATILSLAVVDFLQGIAIRVRGTGVTSDSHRSPPAARAVQEDPSKAEAGSRVEVRFTDRPGLVEPSALIARLVHLEGLRLAQRLSPTSWRLAEGWQQPLREPAARGDILKQIHAAISGDPARYRIVRDGDAVPTDAVGGRGLFRDASRVRVSPTSSKASSMPSSRRPRAGRTASRSTRAAPRRFVAHGCSHAVR